MPFSWHSLKLGKSNMTNYTSAGNNKSVLLYLIFTHLRGPHVNPTVAGCFT